MKLVPLSNFIEYQNHFITIDDGKEYTRVTTKLHRKGVVLRDIVKGVEIKTKKQQICRANQFLVAEIDAKVGGYGIVPKELGGSIVSSHYFLFDVNAKELLPEYLAYVLKTDVFFSQIKAQGSTNYAAIRPKDILKIEIPYFDVDRQRSLVEKLSVVSSENLHLSSNIIRDQEYIQKLRQAILREAVSGKLVPQNPEDEPSSEFLKRIKFEKEELIKEKRLNSEKTLPPISHEEFPYEIPKGWSWVRLGEISTKIGSGSTPRGGRNVYEKTGIPFIRSQNVWDTGLRLDDVACISAEINKKMEGTKVLPGDILLNITGASIGRTCIVPENFKEGNVSQHVSIIRLVSSLVTSFVHFFLLSSYIQNRIMDVQVGISREGLSKKNMELFLIPIPPLSEQKRIIKKIDQLLMLCRVLEEKVKENQSYSEFMMEAVLKEAFAS